MELKLSTNTTISDVKKQFSRYFPFLKLDFFLCRHKEDESSGPRQKVSENLQLIDVTGVLKEGIYLFDGSTTVAEFEQGLQNNHGLPVQVFRKSGDLWIETIQTDYMSLERQNALGSDSVRPIRFNIHTLFL